jgi:hypothetical protein
MALGTFQAESHIQSVDSNSAFHAVSYKTEDHFPEKLVAFESDVNQSNRTEHTRNNTSCFKPKNYQKQLM